MEAPGERRKGGLQTSTGESGIEIETNRFCFLWNKTQNFENLPTFGISHSLAAIRANW